MLVTAKHSELFGDVAEVGGGDTSAFVNPSLNDVGGASFGESEPKDSGFQIIFFSGFTLVFLREIRGIVADNFDCCGPGGEGSAENPLPTSSVSAD